MTFLTVDLSSGCQLFNSEYISLGILWHFHLLSNRNVNRVMFTLALQTVLEKPSQSAVAYTGEDDDR